MDSYEVLKKSVSDLGVKSVASDLGLSTSLIYKWCQPSGSEDASGADNPLDRLARIHELTRDTGPIQWLCEKAGGYYVPNVPTEDVDAIPLLHMTRRIVREFSELLDVLTESIENDGIIDRPIPATSGKSSSQRRKALSPPVKRGSTTNRAESVWLRIVRQYDGYE